MARLTDKERIKLSEYVYECLDKLETPKNAMKPHWKTESNIVHMAEIMVEVHELQSAMIRKDEKKIKSELKDIINTALFMYDNLNNTVRIKE